MPAHSTLGRIDEVLDSGVETSYDALRDTIRVTGPTGEFVVVDAATGQRIVTFVIRRQLLEERLGTLEDVEDVRRIMVSFVDDLDRSSAAVARLEGLVLKHFKGTPLYYRLIEPLALYQPGGGQQLSDEVELVRLFNEVLPELRQLAMAN